jgi:hypothetical protein
LRKIWSFLEILENGGNDFEHANVMMTNLQPKKIIFSYHYFENNELTTNLQVVGVVVIVVV